MSQAKYWVVKLDVNHGNVVYSIHATLIKPQPQKTIDYLEKQIKLQIGDQPTKLYDHQVRALVKKSTIKSGFWIFSELKPAFKAVKVTSNKIPTVKADPKSKFPESEHMNRITRRLSGDGYYQNPRAGSSR